MLRLSTLIAIGLLFGLNALKAAAPDLGATPAAKVDAVSTRAKPTDAIANADVATRLREGTHLVDQSGVFKVQGDGLQFAPANGTRSFSVLQNLAMERISRLVVESPDALEWTMTATVTEFRGANYLLVTQATIKAKPSAARSR